MSKLGTNQASEDMVDEILEDLVYDTPNSYGYPPDFDPDFAKAKQAIIDWHNEQIEAVLDRLESQSRRADDCTDDTLVVKMIRVGAERNRLKESSNE